jgi:hypothetical protein
MRWGSAAAPKISTTAQFLLDRPSLVPRVGQGIAARLGPGLRLPAKGARTPAFGTEVKGVVMLKKIISVVVVGAIAKVVIDRLTGSKNEADLWAEATDPVRPEE